MSNIVQGGRQARRGAAAAAPINYAAIDKASTSSDDEDEAGSAEDQSSSDTQDSDAAGSAEEGGHIGVTHVLAIQCMVSDMS